MSQLQRWKQTAALWPYMCVCACASVSLLVGRSDVLWESFYNILRPLSPFRFMIEKLSIKSVEKMQ